MKPPVFLSIVFSFRNEDDILEELVRRVRAVMSEASRKKLVKGHQMVFVNDASSDGSLPLLLKLAAGQKDICILNMSRTFGVAPCVMAGFAYAQGDAAKGEGLYKAENPQIARPATRRTDLENCFRINEIFLIKCIYAK